QSQQEQYRYRIDVPSYTAQPEANVLDEEELEDDEDLHMEYGDWEEGNYQAITYRPSDAEDYAQTRYSSGSHETYFESPPPAVHPARATRKLSDMRIETHDERYPPPSYGTQPATSRATPPSQAYTGQQEASNAYGAAGISLQTGRQAQQPPHPRMHEQ